MQHELFKELLIQNIQSCGYAFNGIHKENISFRLNEKTSSVGFIYRHIGETMNAFGYFFGFPSEVPNTTMGKQDEGQGNNLEESRELIEKGYSLLQKIIDTTQDDSWLEPIETPFFGVISKVRLFSHILYHNSYHAGQIALALKRGE